MHEPMHMSIELSLPMETGIGVNNIRRVISNAKSCELESVTERDIKDFIYDAIKYFICWNEQH